MKKNLLLLLAFTTVFIGNTWSQTWDQTGNAAGAAAVLGTTNAVPLRLTTNNLPRLVIDVNGKVGIGTSTPVNIFSIKGPGSVPATKWVSAGSPLFTGFAENNIGNGDVILAMASNNVGARPVILGRRARGSLAAPAVVANNDFLASFYASGFDGTNFQIPSGLDVIAEGPISAGNVPARISLVTGSNGGNRLERLKVGSTGNFNFNDNQLTLEKSSGNLRIGVGNLNFANGMQTIQFANPDSASVPMMTMFNSGTQNRNRMVIGHSPTFPTWGLQYEDTTDKFNFLSGGTPVFTADLGSWRVGVGTSSPATRFDIAGTNAWNLASTEGDFRLGNATYRLKMGVATGGAGAGDGYISSSHKLYLGAGTTLGRTQTMTINSNGRVGIGTLTPTSRLEVVGDTATTVPIIEATTSYVGNADVRGVSALSHPADGFGYGVYATGGYRGGYFFGDGGSYSGSVAGVYGAATGDTGTRYGVYGIATGGENNWGGYFPTKTYTSELRVGGTSGAAGYVAAINGKLIATELRVEAIANWPDYVFGKNYKLMPLTELENRINTDKHLPGIPAASEVKDKGIMLGEMQAKTLEKVEELTLYLIQLSKENKELKARLEKLENK